MPIHSLGIEALSGLDRTPFLLALEGGDTLSLHSFTVNKNDLTELLCTAVELRGWQLKIQFCTSHASQKHTSERLHKKKNIKTYSCSPVFTSVNLDKAQARCVSATAGSMNVSLQEKKEKKKE